MKATTNCRRRWEIRHFPAAQIRVRIDAAGRMRGTSGFLRGLPLELLVSVGEPQRIATILAHMPSKKSDKAEAEARRVHGGGTSTSFSAAPQFVMLQQIASRLQGLSGLTRCINRFMV